MVELAMIASWLGLNLDNLVMDLVNMAAFNVALLTWLGYMLAKSPARESTAGFLRAARSGASLSGIPFPVGFRFFCSMFLRVGYCAVSRHPAPPSPFCAPPGDPRG